MITANLNYDEQTMVCKAPNEPRPVTMKDVLSETDENITEALFIACNLAGDWLGVKDEPGNYNAPTVIDATCIMRDKAVHLRELLFLIADRIGVQNG